MHLFFGATSAFGEPSPNTSADRIARPPITITTRVVMSLLYGKARLGSS